VLPAGGERGSGGEGNINVLCNVLFLYIRKLAESRYVVLPSPINKCCEYGTNILVKSLARNLRPSVMFKGKSSLLIVNV
jgi:hypothetical protein